MCVYDRRIDDMRVGIAHCDEIVVEPLADKDGIVIKYTLEVCLDVGEGRSDVSQLFGGHTGEAGQVVGDWEFRLHEGVIDDIAVPVEDGDASEFSAGSSYTHLAVDGVDGEALCYGPFLVLAGCAARGKVCLSPASFCASGE